MSMKQEGYDFMGAAGRLSHISWFMKALCEHIGRRANREDRYTGHFFEGRFDGRDLTSKAAILVCGIYVDLTNKGDVLLKK